LKTLFWFRRDRRLQDNEALASCASEDEIFPLFIFTEDLAALSALREASIIESVKSLDRSIPTGLNLAFGDAAEEITKFVRQHGIERVVATRAFDTSGMLEQAAVGQRLHETAVPLQLFGSYYAVDPGTVRKDDGSFLKVYTPFYKRWLQFGWPAPFSINPLTVNWKRVTRGQIPSSARQTPFQVVAGEDFALRTWERFRERALMSYHEDRNRTDLSGTSHLSHALAHGEIHPRTLLAQLSDSAGEEIYRKELAWREFYADVLFNHPHTVDEYFEPRFANMRYDQPERNQDKLKAWCQGRTGYPIVDAAMRQLVESGWMHNRSRMIVASFLVKDLHFEWQVGAKFFEKHLTDFDPASNSHGWQWTAGCGTDASPYYRIFNPILQGLKFDPRGDYVRRWVPELSHIPDGSIHEPWKLIEGYAAGYPSPVVDHDVERNESLARLEELKLKQRISRDSNE
jgi:deoxyribodipyrimidine photo-lyase